MRAIAALDLDAMVALMHEEMRTTMPPWSAWIEGRADNAVFYRLMFERLKDSSPRARIVGVNGQLGCTFYRNGAVHGVEVIETQGDHIRTIHHFMQGSVLSLFGAG